MRLGTIITLVFVGLVAFYSSYIPKRGAHRATLKQVCTLVGEKFYRDDPALNTWEKHCLASIKDVGFTWSRSRFLNHVQRLLNELEVSHLMVYDPAEDRRLWRGEAVDTGIRSRWIEGHLVVYDVIEKSPAAALEVAPGDELLLINDESVRSAWQAQTSEGQFLLRRGEKQFRLDLKPKKLKIDHAPTLREAKAGVGILRIPSFRGEYFKGEIWKPLAARLPEFKKIVVDLRGNSGGNLVSMLRAVSPFFCETTVVGSLSQPRREKPEGPAPQDNLDEMAQLALLEQYQKVPLQTFSTYGCVKAPVVVLIDGATSSVSEIFSQAMLSRPQTRVAGQPSAGDVVMATWYSLSQLGSGYSVSIPEALFLTMSGESLEGVGIWPQVELQYDLEEAYAGQDSWLNAALHKL